MKYWFSLIIAVDSSLCIGYNYNPFLKYIDPAIATLKSKSMSNHSRVKSDGNFRKAINKQW